MASSNGTKAQPQQLRGYTVVRMTRLGEGYGLTVIAENVQARQQAAACDKVINDLPEAERHGEFGAFLASSLKTFEYETTIETVTKRKRPTVEQPHPARKARARARARVQREDAEPVAGPVA